MRVTLPEVHESYLANFDAMRTELDYQTFEQSNVRNNTELGFEIFKNRVNDARRGHIPKRRATINNPSWINNDVKQAIGKRQRAYETKRRTNNEETVAEYIEAKRQVKRIVKQKKRKKELNIARICKHNPKSFYTYINERRIVVVVVVGQTVWPISSNQLLAKQLIASQATSP